MNNSVVERQLFLYKLTGRGYEFRNKSWHDDWERFEDDQLNMAWEMWLASAQRDGYKLVPLDPPEGMDMKICDLVNHRVDVFEDDRIYKAMIGVVE